MIPDPAPPFEFDASGVLKERIRRMLLRAADIGLGEQISDAVAEILTNLIEKPREWGDPIANLRHAKFVVYHGRHENFLAVYGVHDRIPMVFLFDLIVLPDNPLHGMEFGSPSTGG